MSAHSIIAVLTAVALGTAPSSEVRREIQALYDGGEFEQALTLTINEYRASRGEGVFLYAGANAARALGDCPQATELYERALAKADNPSIKASIAAEIQACREQAVDESALPATFVVRWGDAERALGRCEQATESYRRALRRVASDAEAQAARDGIEACKPAPPPPKQLPPPVPPPPKTDAPRPDRVSWALIGTGAGLTLVGAGLIGGSALQARAATDADERGYRDGVGRANTLLVAGTSVAAVGLGVLLTAAVRWAVRRRRAPPTGRGRASAAYLHTRGAPTGRVVYSSPNLRSTLLPLR